MDFVHLHVHSEYSMLDSSCRVEELARAAAEMGQKALAVTDHGNMFGAVAFYKACKKAGIRPILGCEVYVAPESRSVRDPNEKYHHLTLLCRNAEGYRNLSRLVSAGYVEGFYSRPRIDDELLRKYAGGLIALSGCLSGRIPRLILAGQTEKAEAEVLRYREIFGKDGFFLEIQDHGVEDEKFVREGLIELSEKTGAELVATNDVHYVYRRDADTQAVLKCIQTATTVEEGRPYGFESDEFYLKSASEMQSLFPLLPQALENTVKIADRCEFDFDFSTKHLPSFPLPEGESAAKVLRRLAGEGLKKRAETGGLDLTGHEENDYRMRMIYELMMIEKMGYSDYFLIVRDFVQYAKRQKIPVGPGRGSGAGSLVAYLIGITEVDSIRYDLLFERFLNPERVSMPDFDVDFCYDRRDEVIAYVAEKYGKDHVAQIAAFGTFGARAAVRDAGRALGYSYAETDAVAKRIPHRIDMTIRAALADKDFKKLYDTDFSVRRLLDTAMAVEGLPRHLTTHAAGVVITEKPVWEYLPLAVSSGAPLTQYDMNTVAELGLLKFDFLALRYLTVIDRAERAVQAHTPAFSVAGAPIDDPDAYRLIGQGDTEGLFQLESPGMKRLLVQMRPKCVEDLMIAIAMYRPGPMDAIPEFLKARQSGKAPEYAVPALSEILDGTSGCIVFQEQVMQIFRKVAGYSYGRADVVRRAMAKKHPEELERERQGFLAGAEKNGVGRPEANDLFDRMASFASYAFNKSHAAAYALLSFQTAYLKAHYPAEYLAALLSSSGSDLNKTAEYIESAEKRGVRVLPPDVNESEGVFTAAQGGIRYGLAGIKGVGEGFVQSLLAERRENGPYSSPEDFVFRMQGSGSVNKAQILALIGAGAFDRFGVYRSRMSEGLDEMLSWAHGRYRMGVDGQTDLFSMAGDDATSGVSGVSYQYPEMLEYPLSQRLETEKELTGLWFSGTPMDKYRLNARHMHGQSISEILSQASQEGAQGRDGSVVSFCGMLSSVSLRASKAGSRYAILRVEDAHAGIETLVFEKLLQSVSDVLRKDAAVFVRGKLITREDEAPKVTAQDLLPLIPDEEFEEILRASGQPLQALDPPQERSPRASGGEKPAPAGEKPASGKGGTDAGKAAKPVRLYIRLGGDEKKNRRVRALLQIFPGTVPCRTYDPETAVYSPAGSVSASEYLLSVLRQIAGQENVVLK